MFRRTFTGSLVAASLAAGALLTMPSAQAVPTWTHAGSISGPSPMPYYADVAMNRSGAAIAVWAAADDQDVRRIWTASATHGVWSQPTIASAPGHVANFSKVTLNDHGEAAILWQQVDDDAKKRVTVTQRSSTGTWSTPKYVSPAGVDSTIQDADIDGVGGVVAVYGLNGGVASAEVSRTGVVTNHVLDADANYEAAVDVNAHGTALASWTREVNGETRVVARRFDPASGAWSAPLPVATSASGRHVALDDSGRGTVLFAREVGNAFQVDAAPIDAAGVVGASKHLTVVGDYYPQGLGANTAGTVLAVISHDGDAPVYASRTAAGVWTTGTLPLPAFGADVSVGVSKSGAQYVTGVEQQGQLFTAYRLPGQSWTVKESAPLFVYGSGRVAVDDQGNAVVVSILTDLDPAKGQVHSAFLDVAGPTASITAPAQPLAAKFAVSWTATDRLSNVTTGSVRVRSAAWNGSFGGYTYPLLDKATKALSFTGVPGRTYCFSSQAKDAVGNLSAWSAERCTTVPLDDRSLTRKGFKTRTGSAHYLGTFVQAKKKGARLTLADVKASKIALVVAKAPKGGKVKVTFAGKSLGTYSLKGKGTKQVINLKSLGSLKTGTLVIKVISKSGKVVRIDGVVTTR